MERASRVRFCAAGEVRGELRALDHRADPVDHRGRAATGTGWPKSRIVPARRRRPGRAASGSSWSCPTRWVRGSRARHRPARPGRGPARRPARHAGCGTPCAGRGLDDQVGHRRRRATARQQLDPRVLRSASGPRGRSPAWRRTAPRRGSRSGAARRGSTSAIVTSRPSSLAERGDAGVVDAARDEPVEPPRSTSQLSEKPCMVTPRLTRMPRAAILRSGPRSSAAQPDAAAAGHPGGGRRRGRRRPDQGLLDAAYVVDDLDVVGQRDDRVADQLAGAVEGDRAAAVDVDDRRAVAGRPAGRAAGCACRR